MASVCEASEANDAVTESTPTNTLTVAQRARIERNRLKARTLQDARLVKRGPHYGTKDILLIGHSWLRNHKEAYICPGVNINMLRKYMYKYCHNCLIQKCIVTAEPVKTLTNANTYVIDSGGGFLIEKMEDEPAIRMVQPSAPVVNPTEQPRCLECDQQFPQSYLFDTFDYSVCDSCRDDEEAHSLITRTEAKSDYILQDCDLDKRPPPLRCIRRRNPHRSHYSDMRLYLRAQVEERALEVWGSPTLLEEEKARRKRKREQTKHTQSKRRLRELRMDVRSSLYDRSHATHKHSYGEETHNADDDMYTRTCTTCGHVESYEKM